MRIMCGMKNTLGTTRPPEKRKKKKISNRIAGGRESKKSYFINWILLGAWKTKDKKEDTEREIITYICFERTDDLFIFFNKQRKNGR